jgi:cysteine-rich repeat protein
VGAACSNLAAQIAALPGVDATCSSPNVIVTTKLATSSVVVFANQSCAASTEYACTGTPSTCVASVCGNGKKEGAEQCDDGNPNSDDGCSANCLVEAGYSCPTPGSPCVLIPAMCGDGIIQAGQRQQRLHGGRRLPVEREVQRRFGLCHHHLYARRQGSRVRRELQAPRRRRLRPVLPHRECLRLRPHGRLQAGVWRWHHDGRGWRGV